jgi:hypothetical protein
MTRDKLGSYSSLFFFFEYETATIITIMTAAIPPTVE